MSSPEKILAEGAIELDKVIPVINHDFDGSDYSDLTIVNGLNSKLSYPPITPLPSPLLPVEPFSYLLLPDGPLHIHTKDIAERMQCPPDYVAVAIMVSLASVIGRSHQIKPKQFDDWTIVPNLWALIIGRPSQLKTPAVNEAMKHLKRAEINARELYGDDLEEYKADAEVQEMSLKLTKEDARKLLKSGDTSKAKELLKEATKEIELPVQKRYLVNDSTIEKLGELLTDNPNGLLQFRDELSGFLKGLDSEQKPNDRAFYLESFNGTGSYTYDRIGRGTVFIDHVVLSLLGTIQPGRYSAYIGQAIRSGKGDDGLAQRFQLSVYPDEPKVWKNIDRYPNNEAKNQVFEQFENLVNLVDSISVDEPVILHFDAEAQTIFNDWWHDLENNKLRNDDIHPALVSHLAKYRSLMPSIALIIHLVESPDNKTKVSKSATLKACGWCEYLESHARRIYSAATNNPVQIASLILKKVKSGKLKSGFTLRHIQRKGWAGLTENSEIKQGLELLVEHGHLISHESQGTGCPSTSFVVNPAALKGANHE